MNTAAAEVPILSFPATDCKYWTPFLLCEVGVVTACKLAGEDVNI